MLGPRHGYEFLPYFSRGGELGLVCTLGTPRLYAILHALEELGLVQCETEPPSSGPPRKVFSVTDAGTEAFRDWLGQPIRRLRQIRQDFLLKLYFSRLIPGYDTRGVVEGQIRASRAVSEELRAAAEAEPPSACRSSAVGVLDAPIQSLYSGYACKIRHATFLDNLQAAYLQRRRKLTMSTEPPFDQQAAQSALMPLIWGYRASLLLLAVAELKIADALADGPLTCAEIAVRTGTQAGPVYRVLRALATYGVFAETEDGRFKLTPPAHLMRSDVPGSLRDLTLFTTSHWVQQAWGQLTYTMRTGETAFPHVHGAPVFEWLATHPDEAAVFSRAMAGRTTSLESSIVESYDFSGANVVVDVGGGHGALLGLILSKHPHLRGVLFDLPHVVAGARERLGELGVADRCDFVVGDFFKSVPAGGDIYIMSRIIHDWNDERSIAILKQCQRAMSDTSKLLLVEEIIPPGNDPHPAKQTDIMMLLVPGGAERTEVEYQTLFEASGFRLDRVVPTSSSLSVIGAIRN